MGIEIDTKFDVYSDARGRDPDSHSPTLRRYHKMLWSKALPDGTYFTLSDAHPGDYLHHKSHLGEFVLSSDSLGHTYRYVKAMAGIITQVPNRELDEFFSICSTVGAYIIFPARKIDGKTTINAGRGLDKNIRDRFDLTLECIRKHYLDEASPLSAVLARYADFFSLFENFQGYVDFFLLQDLVSEDAASVSFFLPFKGFESAPLPADLDAYLTYRNKMIAFVTARNLRVMEQAERVTSLQSGSVLT